MPSTFHAAADGRHGTLLPPPFIIWYFEGGFFWVFSSILVVLQLEALQNLLEDLLAQSLPPGGVGGGARKGEVTGMTCVSNKFPGDADAAGPGTTL